MRPKLNKALLEDKLQALRISSLSQLAKLSGIHRNSLYPLIRGLNSPFTETYLSICQTLNVSPLALVSEEREQETYFIVESLNQIISALKPQSEGYAFFLYGSRTTGRARKFSDYDIGVTGGERHLAWQEYLILKEMCSEKFDNLAVKVSVLDFDQAPATFLDEFDSPLEFLCGNQNSFSFFKGTLYGRTKKKEAA